MQTKYFYFPKKKTCQDVSNEGDAVWYWFVMGVRVNEIGAENEQLSERGKGCVMNFCTEKLAAT